MLFNDGDTVVFLNLGALLCGVCTSPRVCVSVPNSKKHAREANWQL